MRGTDMTCERKALLVGAGVAVGSDSGDASGPRTTGTSVRVRDSSLSILGSVGTPGSLRDAAREGADLMLVTADGYYGPMYMGAGDMKSPTAAGGPSSGIA